MNAPVNGEVLPVLTALSDAPLQHSCGCAANPVWKQIWLEMNPANYKLMLI